MIKESRGKSSGDNSKNNLAFFKMTSLAIATSIDALAVGVAFALQPGINIYASVCLIGIVAFSISAIGVNVGTKFGILCRGKAEMSGGVILICIGVKFLVEGLLKL